MVLGLSVQYNSVQWIEVLRWLTLSCLQELLVRVSRRLFQNWLGHPWRRYGAGEVQTLDHGREQASGRKKAYKMKYFGYVHRHRHLSVSGAQSLRRGRSSLSGSVSYGDQRSFSGHINSETKNSSDGFHRRHQRSVSLMRHSCLILSVIPRG